MGGGVNNPAPLSLCSLLATLSPLITCLPSSPPHSVLPYTHRDMHTDLYTHTHACVQISTQAMDTQTCLQIYVQTCTHECTNLHTYTHRYKHTHMLQRHTHMRLHRNRHPSHTCNQAVQVNSSPKALRSLQSHPWSGEVRRWVEGVGPRTMTLVL